MKKQSNNYIFGINEQSTKGTELWTKSKILARIGQEEIMERFLGIPVHYRGYIRSPLRKDKQPTCTFRWLEGKLLFRDWAETKSKDCFDIVKEHHSCDFYTSLEIIAKEFNLTEAVPREGFTPDTIAQESYKKHENNEKSIIEIKRQPYTTDNIRYFKKYHLTRKIVEYYNVYGVKAVWLNGSLMYADSIDRPALAYYFGTDQKGRQKWKIYFYKGIKAWRFIGNTNRINGWIQLPEKGELLIITKSLKDVMCLARFGIPAIAMQGEHQIPYKSIIEELANRFDTLYTLLDYDITGVRSANKIKKLYDIPALFFKDKYKAKDFSDYIAFNGLEKTTKLVTQALKKGSLNPDNFNLPS